MGVLVVRVCWLRPLPEDKKAAQTKWSHLPLKEATGPDRKTTKKVHESKWKTNIASMVWSGLEFKRDEQSCFLNTKKNLIKKIF